MKTAGPPEKSRYSFPSMSRTIAPSASHSTVSPPRRKSRTSPGLTTSPYLRNVSSTIRRRSAGSMTRETSAAAGWRDSSARPHRGTGLQGLPRPAADLLLHLPPGHGFGSLARFDGAFGQHPLAALVLQQQNLWTRGRPAKDHASGAAGALHPLSFLASSHGLLPRG